jgi:hypothetical protein
MGDGVPTDHLDVSPVLAVASAVLALVLLRPLLLGDGSTPAVVVAAAVGGAGVAVATWVRRRRG